MNPSAPSTASRARSCGASCATCTLRAKVTIILVTHDLREAAFLADRIFCMSARPGRIIAERRVKFPRPRDLDITYAAEFTDLVHDLRSQIASARQAA